MRLFSEEVSPTLTSSNLNIITVKDYNEIFFDVFELEINGKKYVAEKVDSYNGQPVVSIPIVKDGKEYTMPFVLNKGKFNILYNEKNLTFVRDIEEEKPEDIVPEVYIPTEVETIDEIFNEKRKDFKDEVAKSYNEAKNYAEEIKREKISEANKLINERKYKVDAEIKDIKQDLITDFVDIVTVIKADLNEARQEDIKHLNSYINESISAIYDTLVDNIDKKTDDSYNTFVESINKLAEDTLTSLVTEKFNNLNNTSNQSIQETFNKVKVSIDKITEKANDRVSQRLADFNSSITALERANVELNSTIQKNSNRALSRIGNLKTALEESLSKEVEDIQDKISLVEDKVIAFYEDKLQSFNEKVTNLNSDTRNECIRLIRESKESLLRTITEIKHEVPNIVIERQDGNDVKIDLKKVKSELEKSISARFTNELMSLKRMMEMTSGGGGGGVVTSGGGSNLDDGGVINGDLTVLGSVSAREYYTTSSTFADYSQQAVFKSNLVLGNNNIITFPIRVNPTLSTIKFYVTFFNASIKTVCEIFVLVNSNQCIGNVYSIIHSNNDTPLMTDLNCSIFSGNLQLNATVSQPCVCVISGNATYVL